MEEAETVETGRARPRSEASPPSSRCRTRSPRSTIPRSCASVLRGRRARRVQRVLGGVHHQGARGRGARADGRAVPPRRADLHRRRRLRRRRRRHAPRARVLAGAARCGRRAARRGRRARGQRLHARGRVVEPPRHSRPARGRGGRHRRPRPDPRRAHRCARALPARVALQARSSWFARRRRDGLPVTAEAAPHHFTLTDECCASFDPVFKVHPPLRTDADVEAIKRGLADGTIDAIATDHAPHPVEQKERPFEEAPAGMLGLETSLALALTELVEPGVLSLVDALALLSWRPAVDRRIARRSRATDRARRRRQPLRDRPRRQLGGRRAAPREQGRATRRSPVASSPAACATRSCAANRSSSTARPSDDRSHARFTAP